MTSLMIVLASVRPNRAGEPVAHWARAAAEAHGGFEIDFVDLKELALPFMDEPGHPAARAYTQPHTIAWSERVSKADAFLVVTPEYNHSYSPVLKNAIDFLYTEWFRKPIGFVSYGGISAGTRSVAGLEPVLTTVGLVKTHASVEIPSIGQRVADGSFEATEKEASILTKVLDELIVLDGALRPLR